MLPGLPLGFVVMIETSDGSSVYLPLASAGSWTLTKDRSVHQGGGWVTVHAEISEFIAFVKTGAEVLEAFKDPEQ